MSDDLLSPLHRKLLKRLVGKYGSGLIAREAMKIRATPRSGPPRTNMWDDVQWIEERADELGRGYGAVKRATTERFMMVIPHSKHTAVALSRFTKRIKNARDLWSRTERLHRAARTRIRPRS